LRTGFSMFSTESTNRKPRVSTENTITLSVISANDEVVKLCREVLRELGDTRWELRVYRNAEVLVPSSICLWDYEQGQSIPPRQPSGSQKNFYMVSPAHLEGFRATMPFAEGNILLKPVTRAILQAFLGSVTSPASNPTGEVGTLRADRDEFLQCLLHANLRLQEYDQQRTNFIARAVHDFRAPLTAFSGFCGLLVSEQLGPLNDQQKEALQRMQHSTKRISRMASAMFDLSIGTQVGHDPEPHEGDICECIKQAVHEILPLAREKQIGLHATSVIGPAQPLHFETSQIEQVLVNLLDNACKFTPKFGSIEVVGYPYFWERRFLHGDTASVDRRKNSVRSPNSYRVDIKDTGPGVPPEQLERIFEEYTSYAGARDRSCGGLGLAICRLIISRHHGRVWADSGQNGAVFSFVLPYRKPVAQEASKAGSQDRIIGEYTDGLKREAEDYPHRRR
jgi:signal transduction histidine kinase